MRPSLDPVQIVLSSMTAIVPTDDGCPKKLQLPTWTAMLSCTWKSVTKVSPISPTPNIYHAFLCTHNNLLSILYTTPIRQLKARGSTFMMATEISSSSILSDLASRIPFRRWKTDKYPSPLPVYVNNILSNSTYPAATTVFSPVFTAKSAM